MLATEFEEKYRYQTKMKRQWKNGGRLEDEFRTADSTKKIKSCLHDVHGMRLCKKRIDEFLKIKLFCQAGLHLQ